MGYDMAYIPESHKKYNLLPRRTEKGGEVFSYPSTENEISVLLPEGEDVMLNKDLIYNLKYCLPMCNSLFKYRNTLRVNFTRNRFGA